VKTVKFRVRNPIKWLAPLISTVYLIGVVFLCIQNFKFLLILTAGSRFLFLLVLAPAIAPLFLLLWLLSPARQVRMGEDRFVLAWGDDVLDQITYPEIAHMRITGIGQQLDIFDRAGVQRLHIEPLKGYYSNKSAEILDFMRTQLPHLENKVEKKKGQNNYVERYVDFPPQQNQGPQQPQPQPGWQQPHQQGSWQQPQPPTGWQQPQGQPGWQQSPQQPTYQQPQGQSGWR